MAQRPNFYRLLELDPSVEDPTRIAERIAEKQREWSRDKSQGNPRDKRRAAQALPLLAEMKAVLGDPVRRREEAAAARREEEAERRARVAEVDAAIETLRAGGRCDAKQLDRLVKRFAGAFSRAELESRLRSAGVPIGDAPQPSRRSRSTSRQPLDPVTASKILQNLEIVGGEDLYAFLGLARTHSAQALREQAEKVYRAGLKTGRTDAEITARNELAGLAKQVFRDDEQKARYDAYLALAAMEALKPNLEIAGADGFVTRKELDTLLHQARTQGVPADEALAFIEEYAAKRKWRLQPTEDLPAEALRRCGACGRLADAGSRRCAGCGGPLERKCPRCGESQPSDHASCSHCGANVGDAPLVEALVWEGKEKATEGDLAEAIRHFERALHYWPDWPPAVAAKKQVETRRAAREKALREVEELVRTRHLTAAGTALDRFVRAQGVAGTDRLRDEIAQGIKRAEAACRKAARLAAARHTDRALDLYEEALEACADYAPARRAIAASPPPPPASLAVDATAGGFRLRWTAASNRPRTRYRVIRKEGGAPNHGDDGEVLGEVSDRRFDDTSVPAGRACWYAVFTSRGGVVSSAAADSGPHLRTAEVENLDAVAGDGEVRLSWRAPTGCRRVEVRRREGDPPAGGGGHEVVTAGRTARDGDVVNGRRYGYRVQAVYPDPARRGEVIRSPGRTVVATPTAPPAAVVDLRAERRGREVILSWTPVAGATVEIYRAPERPSLAPGEMVSPERASRMGEAVARAAPGSARTTLDAFGRTWFVPVTVAGDSRVAGRPAEILALDPVRRLVARKAGRDLLLTWHWPTGADAAVVRWAFDAPPGSAADGPGGRKRISRREYDRQGGWRLRHAEQRPHHLAVFACAEGDDYAPPARTTIGLGRETTVRYRVLVKRGLLGRAVREAWVELTANGDGPIGALGPLLLVGRQRRAPLSVNDGEVLAEIASVRFENGRALLPIPRDRWASRPYVKLFFKDPARAREVRLLPAARQLQVA